MKDSEVHASCRQDGPGSAPWPGRQREGLVLLLSLPDSWDFHICGDISSKKKCAVHRVLLHCTIVANAAVEPGDMDQKDG